MQDRIAGQLKGMTFGVAQTHGAVTVLPLTDGDGDKTRYITMAEAMENGSFTITEVSQGGSVPELKVTNDADVPVLLLDGEELAGAKQNRVLNTTVLAPPKQTLVIPVSCTEQGRWTYATPEFYDSGAVMARSIRARKSRSVSESLEASASFRSDQGEVWNGIHELQTAAGSDSPTAAMRDVFESRRESLDEAIAAFPLVPGQVGILVCIGGAVVGFDVLSRAAAYGRLHAKLLKSYVVDALVAHTGGRTDAAGAAKAGRDFVKLAVRCEEKTFKSVGCGDDFRFKGSRIAGSALVYNDTVIHTAFFRLDPAQTAGRMAGAGRRSSYRVF